MTDNKELKDFAELVHRMRTEQRNYFLMRRQNGFDQHKLYQQLDKSKMLEHDVDLKLSNILTPQSEIKF